MTKYTYSINDYVSTRINDLLILWLGKKIWNHRRWRCECLVCWKQLDVRKYHLIKWEQQNCGCTKIKHKTQNGDKYNRLTIIWDVFTKNKRRYVNTECVCWNKQIILYEALRTWHTKSCGCLNIEKRRMWIHLMSKTRFYSAWINMKQRCNNINSESYKYYWWRWITYDPKRDSFDGFKHDVYATYLDHVKKYGEKQTTLDRFPDTDWNYTKENCRRATYKEQARNTSRNVYIKHNWDVMLIADAPKNTWMSMWKIIRLIEKWEIERL